MKPPSDLPTDRKISCQLPEWVVELDPDTLLLAVSTPDPLVWMSTRLLPLDAAMGSIITHAVTGPHHPSHSFGKLGCNRIWITIYNIWEFMLMLAFAMFLLTTKICIYLLYTFTPITLIMTLLTGHSCASKSVKSSPKWCLNTLVQVSLRLMWTRPLTTL